MLLPCGIFSLGFKKSNSTKNKAPIGLYPAFFNTLIEPFAVPPGSLYASVEHQKRKLPSIDTGHEESSSDVNHSYL